MTVSRDWEQVKRLFHDALDVAVPARLAFVKERAEKLGMTRPGSGDWTYVRARTAP